MALLQIIDIARSYGWKFTCRLLFANHIHYKFSSNTVCLNQFPGFQCFSASNMFTQISAFSTYNFCSRKAIGNLAVILIRFGFSLLATLKYTIDLPVPVFPAFTSVCQSEIILHFYAVGHVNHFEGTAYT
ncbi:hypothetical protein BDQ17DRAFT_156320 [Cyathus striatus]|nr:hypothetical protein BDQ17DRAFT_156320 [Cyathus striatus]